METFGLTALGILMALALKKMVPVARQSAVTAILCAALLILVLPGVVSQTASWRVHHYPALTTHHERDVVQQVERVQNYMGRISAYK